VLALLHSDAGFSIPAVGVVIIAAIALLAYFSPLFDWIPDVVYWLLKRGKRRDGLAGIRRRH